eukprot:550710-Pyramimonas_sp.AAC.1
MHRTPPQGDPGEANVLETPTTNQWCLAYRCFTSDGNSGPQRCPKRAQEGPRRGPPQPRKDPRGAQGCSKSAPRGVQDAIIVGPRAGRPRWTPPIH